MARWKNHGTTSDFVMRIVYFFTALYKLIGKKVYPLKSIFDVIEYRYWLESTFSARKIFPNKTGMLNFLVDKMNTKEDKSTRIIEFGVAFGETTKYLANKLTGTFEYHGFDTFTGLPRSWRGLPEGAISAGGLVPEIHQENIFFYKGLIEETLDDPTLERIFASPSGGGGYFKPNNI